MDSHVSGLGRIFRWVSIGNFPSLFFCEWLSTKELMELLIIK